MILVGNETEEFLKMYQGVHHVRRAQGNVLLILLLAIALFGILGAFIMDTETGTDTGSSEKTKLIASEIIAYASTVKGAIARLQAVNGCTDTQISFEGYPLPSNPDGNDYADNNAAPADNRCHVFHPEGGGVKIFEAPAEWFDASYSAFEYHGFSFLQGLCINGVGNGVTACSSGTDEEREDAVDLVFMAAFLREDICTEINNQIGQANQADGTPPTFGSRLLTTSGGLFEGSYTRFNRTVSDLDGKPQLCTQRTGTGGWPDAPGTNHYYHVILPR